MKRNPLTETIPQPKKAKVDNKRYSYEDILRPLIEMGKL